MTTVCLFDIDGTLLNSGGAGQHAMEQALLETFGVTGPYTDIQAAGRTDRAITSDLFDHHQLEESDENWSRFQSCYLACLPNSLSTQNGRILPGIIEILNRLSENETVAMGLLTGNLQAGAEVKLRHYGLDHHFSFGGYGDHNRNRDDVAHLALREACQHLDRDVSKENVWVIGDTPSDVTCGRAIGARTMAVATGIYDSAVLKETQPDYLFEDFSDVTSVIQCLTNQSN